MRRPRGTLRTVPHTPKLVLPALLAGAVLFAPTSALAAGDACDERLDPDRKEVYKYTNGKKTLGFGRVVVQATEAQYHRYCVKVQFGGRTPLNAFGESSDLRRDGEWVNEGGLGFDFEAGGGYNRTIQVRDKSRINMNFSIKRDGRVYSTVRIRRINL